MADELYAEIELDVGDKVIEKLEEKLKDQDFEINASLSEASIENIQDQMAGVSFELSTELDDSLNNITEGLGGVMDGLSESFGEVNSKIVEMSGNLDDAANAASQGAEETERAARASNLNISNDLAKKAIAAAGAATSAGAIRGAGNEATSLQILQERTGIDYDTLGRFASGLSTGRELMSSEQAFGATEDISNKITDLLTGTNPEGAKLLNLLGVQGTDINRQDVIESIMTASKTDFGDKLPEVNRLFEQILGINFNALKGGDFSENLYTDQSTAVAIRESKRELEAEYKELTQNLSGLNVVFNDLTTTFLGFGNDFYEASKSFFTKTIEFAKGIGEPKDMGDYQDLFELPNHMYDFKKFDSALRMEDKVGMKVLNDKFEDIQTYRNSNKSARDAVSLKPFTDIIGSDLRVQESEMTSENMRKLAREFERVGRILEKNGNTTVNVADGNKAEVNIMKGNAR